MRQAAARKKQTNIGKMKIIIGCNHALRYVLHFDLFQSMGPFVVFSHKRIQLASARVTKNQAKRISCPSETPKIEMIAAMPYAPTNNQFRLAAVNENEGQRIGTGGAKGATDITVTHPVAIANSGSFRRAFVVGYHKRLVLLSSPSRAR